MTNFETNPVLRIKEKSLLPIVQGGMGVGISAHRLAGTVAGVGAVGTLSSVDLRRHHPDLMAQTAKSRDKALINRVNLIAIDREIRAARKIAGGNGMIAVNIMYAISEYAANVRQSCESGAEAIVVGAGLPFNLPDLTSAYPAVALISILSDSRGIGIVLKKWLRKSRLPDAIVIEHPRYAGGHLGAAKIDDLDDARFAFPRVLEETFMLFKELGIDRRQAGRHHHAYERRRAAGPRGPYSIAGEIPSHAAGAATPRQRSHRLHAGV